MKILGILLLSYLIGSIPSGYLIVKLWKKIDIRDYGSHNIGAANVLRVIGKIPFVLTLAGDIFKGFLPVYLTWLIFQNPWLIFFSAFLAIFGHAYSLYFLIKERKFSRGKGVATGAGVLLALTSLSIIPLWVLLATVSVYGIFAFAFRYASLASMAGAWSFPLWMFLSKSHPAFLLLSLFVALFVLWKHKENIGRLLDHLEPKFGQKVPLATFDNLPVCAFLIHPLSEEDWFQTRRFSWLRWPYEKGLIPLSFLKSLARFFRPMKVDEFEVVGVKIYLLGVPILPDQIKNDPELAVKRAIQSARLAKDLGASVLGLGAFWSVVGGGGWKVQKKSEIAITNGGVYTVGAAIEALRKEVELKQVKLAIIGATGVIGQALTKILVREVKELILIGRDEQRLAQLRSRVKVNFPHSLIRIATKIKLIKEAEVVIGTTSDPNPVIFPEHLKKGAIILDIARPADVSEEVKQRKDVKVIEGGVIKLPEETKGRLDLHFGKNQIPACLAETIILAKTGEFQRKTLGARIREKNIRFFMDEAKNLGLEVVSQSRS